MKKVRIRAPRLVSSDLNGTLVHQHTMSDMIRVYKGNRAFGVAKAVFTRQTDGQATMREAFSTAGPLTKGLTLRQAIQYVKEHMEFIDGFKKFLDFLKKCNIPLVINSTGYSVTIYAIQQMMGEDRIHGSIGNSLKFGLDGDALSTLTESELRNSVISYLSDSEVLGSEVYDRIKATGIVELGIESEGAKAHLIQKYAAEHFPDVQLSEIMHMGDTMGDSLGICEIAKAGGIGVAFNYNEALRLFLMGKLEAETIPGSIHLIDPKNKTASLTRVIPVIDSTQGA